MLGNSFAVKLGGQSVTLVRMNQDGYSSEYFGRGTNLEVRFNIKHNFPKTRTIKGTENHLIRMDVDRFNPDGTFLKRESVWAVSQTALGTQDSASLWNVWEALFLGFANPENMQRVYARES
jgi:hypothetical protein